MKIGFRLTKLPMANKTMVKNPCGWNWPDTNIQPNLQLLHTSTVPTGICQTWSLPQKSCVRQGLIGELGISSVQTEQWGARKADNVPVLFRLSTVGPDDGLLRESCF